MQRQNVYNNSIDGANSTPDEGLQNLVSSAQKGEEQALGQLYTLYFDKIFRFIFFRVNHKETAEDLAEETFVKAFKSLKSMHKPERFEAWLYQIARNIVVDHYRSKKATVALDEVENTLEYENAIVDVLSIESDAKLVLDLLKQLPTEQQIVIKLKFLEELSNSEIAELLHKSEGAIRIIQFRGLSKLKSLIEVNYKRRNV